MFDFAGLRATAGEKEKGEGGGEKRGSKSQQEVVGDGTASRGEDAPWPHSTFSPSHPLVIHSATASDTNKITSHTTITSTSTVDNSSNRNDDGHLVIAGASVPLEMNAMGVANKKKKKKTKPPPDTYVCRLCGIKGHWLWQCSEKSGEERKRKGEGEGEREAALAAADRDGFRETNDATNGVFPNPTEETTLQRATSLHINISAVSTKRHTAQKKAKQERALVLCKFFMDGACHRGANCTFSHSGTPTKKKDPCRFFIGGHCSKGAECLYNHHLPCVHFFTVGRCRHGQTCRFSHETLTADMQAILEKHLTELEDSEVVESGKEVDMRNDSGEKSSGASTAKSGRDMLAQEGELVSSEHKAAKDDEAHLRNKMMGARLPMALGTLDLAEVLELSARATTCLSTTSSSALALPISVSPSFVYPVSSPPSATSPSPSVATTAIAIPGELASGSAGSSDTRTVPSFKPPSRTASRRKSSTANKIPTAPSAPALYIPSADEHQDRPFGSMDTDGEREEQSVAERFRMHDPTASCFDVD